MDEFVENLKKMKRQGDSQVGKRPITNKRKKIDLASQVKIAEEKRKLKRKPDEELKKRKKRPLEAQQRPENPLEPQNKPKKKKAVERKSGPKKKRRKLSPEEIERRRKKKQKEQILEIVKFVLPVIIMAVIVFLFIFNTSPHMVDGDSMNPTLINGDKVIVTRTKKPERYDIITFDPPVDSDFQYVKRVIGMPGDAIWVNGSELFINEGGKVPENMEETAANELPDGTIKVTLSTKALEQLENVEKIPENCYFVLGDNRDNSSDSRDFGLVGSSSIEGIVSFRYGPMNSIGWIS
ncbi:signal peptidase I [Candidatus Enterococcus clewellii]|uniref:Signal peptidase I n=1 Tax=Candidatus Enterococcus clewellii TaxID=1834193 RepID=A0A242K3G8_9ENTE|nr:signal peptidase I [Enterococcus sp. 9E7_DIV0242]OTP13538.1 signal peptidase I [Enterococcus sp. 9E7_DIV0242]